jgi:hypothetical protein
MKPLLLLAITAASADAVVLREFSRLYWATCHRFGETNLTQAVIDFGATDEIQILSALHNISNCREGGGSPPVPCNAPRAEVCAFQYAPTSKVCLAIELCMGDPTSGFWECIDRGESAACRSMLSTCLSATGVSGANATAALACYDGAKGDQLLDDAAALARQYEIHFVPCVYVGRVPTDPIGSCTDGNVPLSYDKVRSAMCDAGSKAEVCKR